MTQAQEMEAIDRFVTKFKAVGPAQQKLVQDWHNWYKTRTWYQKNMDPKMLEQAKMLQNELITTIGAETTKLAGNFTKKGTVVPIPSGYRMAWAKEITPKIQSFAKAALANFGAISKVKGEAAAIGMRYSAAVDGKQYLAQCEWHFDNHPKGGGPPYWHMGSTIYLPTNPIAKTLVATAKKSTPATSMFRTTDPTLAALSTSNPYA